MTRDLPAVFEIAKLHQLEVNAGIAIPDAVGINLLSYGVLPRKTPLLVISEEICIAEVKEQSLAVVDPYPYGTTAGGYLGFGWVIERSEHDGDNIDRYVLGALTRKFNGDKVLWTPVDTAQIMDVYAKLEDDLLADEIIETLIGTQAGIDIHELIRLCERIPVTDDEASQLYMALINSMVKPEEIFSSVYSNGSIEWLDNYDLSWGEDLGITKYEVKKGDMFILKDEEGQTRLAISRRFSERKVKEKVITVTSENGFERAAIND